MKLRAAQWLMTVAIITPWIGGLIAFGILSVGVYRLFASNIGLGLLKYFCIAAFIAWAARFMSGVMFSYSQALVVSAAHSLQQESERNGSES
ncbi:MAG: hypothetical protein ACT4PZ_17625 [Panacagrimonas sp.]